MGLLVAFLIKGIVFEFLSDVGRAGTYIAIVLYLIVAIFAAYLGARVGAKIRIVPVPRGAVASATAGAAKIVDTSSIVDGRIVEIVESGFMEGVLIVPRFVLRELQAISDSVDPLKRTRGRRGFDVLSRLQELGVVEISERDYDDMAPGNVDARLVRLAQELEAKLVTNDYNLNRIAQVEGVAVLNVNELANAVKPVVLPGEELHVAGDTRGERVSSRRWLSGGRHDDRRRARAALDRRRDRRDRHERAPNRRGAHDLRAAEARGCDAREVGCGRGRGGPRRTFWAAEAVPRARGAADGRVVDQAIRGAWRRSTSWSSRPKRSARTRCAR